MRRLILSVLMLALFGCSLLGQRTGREAQGKGRDIKLETEGGAGQKLALVIGNDKYKNFRPLQNAVNDAVGMAQVLKETGFRVDLRTNATRRDMDEAIYKFLDSLRAEDVALVYYAGHGVQIEGENYLIPVDLDARDQTDVRYGAYSASRLHDKLQETGAKLKIMIFDACRNNPFRTSRSIGGEGLAQMTSGEGSYIAFATSPGRVASDNSASKNGLFTEHLIRALRLPGLKLNEVFDQVRAGVYTDSEKQQLPWSSTSVIGDFYFRAAIPVVTPAPAPIIKEVIREVPKEVIREVPKEVIREVPRDVIREVRVGTTGASRRNPKDKLDYVWIPAGRFQMGCPDGIHMCSADERPVHEVEITRGFWLGMTEVEVKAFRRYLDEKKLPLPKDTMDNPKWRFTDRPMTHVSWEEAQSFCQWAGGRLPTEAEWEYAARGGVSGKLFPWGDSIDPDKANVGGRKGADKFDFTAPVKAFDANGFGLYDMSGNVWEWVADWYDENAYTQAGALSKDPKGPETGAFHVSRGGGWYGPGEEARVTIRGKRAKESNVIGLRCVWEQ